MLATKGGGLTTTGNNRWASPMRLAVGRFRCLFTSLVGCIAIGEWERGLRHVCLVAGWRKPCPLCIMHFGDVGCWILDVVTVSVYSAIQLCSLSAGTSPTIVLLRVSYETPKLSNIHHLTPASWLLFSSKLEIPTRDNNRRSVTKDDLTFCASSTHQSDPTFCSILYTDMWDN
jgi:hypothetical protein